MTEGVELSLTEEDRGPSRGRLMLLFWLAAAASVVLPLVPYGRNVLYPFALLGTWAHEMGHGLVALLLGGSFERLEIYRNLGGVAFHSGVGSFGRVLVSAGGLIGPAVPGALVIVYGSRPRTARWVLAVLSVAVALSVVFFVRNLFGVIALAVIAAVAAVFGFRSPGGFRLGLTQLLGIQLCLASWGTLDYMFTRDFVRDGQRVDSDTQNIAEVLFLPYWFWGGVTAALSLAILAWAFYLAWLRSERRSALAPPTLPT
ncbi:MAG: M50 family metallopeptidase [Acidimicrobiia bacterium]|nr:M50 family metallopeptidase [Acidimicrobiia bacterium]